MPLRKFRSIEEMDGNTWREPGDPELFRAMRSTWALAQKMTRPSFPPGVHRHRSAAEAEALQTAWEEENFRAFRERRAGRIAR